MTQVGAYRIEKNYGAFALVDRDGRTVDVFRTAREAMERGVALTAAAYKARAK